MHPYQDIGGGVREEYCEPRPGDNRCETDANS
jgi:hypothetical protein